MAPTPPRPTLDVMALYYALDGARQERGLSWRAVARATGVSPSTLSRMKDERKPDADSLTKLLDWLGVSADGFVHRGKRRGKSTGRAATAAAITAALRSDPQLTDDDVGFVMDALDAVYRYVTAGKGKG